MTLAEKCDTSTSYIGQIEIGNRFPSFELIKKIAEALQIKPYLFFTDEFDIDTAKIQPLTSINAINIPDVLKDKLVKRLNSAINSVIEEIDK